MFSDTATMLEPTATTTIVRNFQIQPSAVSVASIASSIPMGRSAEKAPMSAMKCCFGVLKRE